MEAGINAVLVENDTRLVSSAASDGPAFPTAASSLSALDHAIAAIRPRFPTAVRRLEVEMIIAKLTCYHFANFCVVRDVTNLINQSNSIACQIGTLKRTDSHAALIQLLGTVPISYKSQTYNIPINIWLVENYPSVPPTCYVTPTPDMRIKHRHRHVDDAGLIYLPYLNQWNRNTSTLVDLFNSMIPVFSDDPPVHWVGPKDVSGSPVTKPTSTRLSTSVTSVLPSPPADSPVYRLTANDAFVAASQHRSLSRPTPSAQDGFTRDSFSSLFVASDAGADFFVGGWGNNISFHGKGEIRYANGDNYVGEFRSGVLYGVGKYTSANPLQFGDTFDGVFNDGQFVFGKSTFSNDAKTTHEGQFVNWKPNNWCSSTELDGTKYDGEWKHGLKTGEGTMQWPNGDTFDGMFRLGQPCVGKWVYAKTGGNSKLGSVEWNKGMFENCQFVAGETRRTLSDGRHYEGKWSEGAMNGTGKLISADSKVTHIGPWKDGLNSMYNGEFKDGKKNGHGTIIWIDKSRYDGDFVDDAHIGQFQFTWADDSKYDGMWKTGFVTEGTYTLPNGLSYAGTWTFNPKDAYEIAQIVHSSGDVFAGPTHNFKPNGVGTLISADGKIRYSGPIKDGVYDGDSGKMMNSTHMNPNEHFEYTGQFQLGKMVGRGVMVWDNRHKFEGEFVGGFRGVGTYTWADGSCYVVTRSAEDTALLGVFTDTDGNVRLTEGPFIFSEVSSMTGRGTISLPNGETFVGVSKSFRLFDGRRNYTSGNVEWNIGKFDIEEQFISGKTKRKLNDGRCYEGEWNNGRPNGEGKFADTDGQVVYIGTFKDGLKHGQKCKLINNSSLDPFHRFEYIGDFVTDLQHGQGFMRWADGRIWDGGFAFGEPDGKGSWWFAAGAKFEGIFRKGKFITGSHVYGNEMGTYVGECDCVRVDEWNGKGVRKYQNGDIFDGVLKCGKPYVGRLTYSEARNGVYWTDGSFDEHGVFSNGKTKRSLTDATGLWLNAVYEGDWSQDAMNGVGSVVTVDGKQRYIGSFQAGVKSGKGSLQNFGSGDTYDGEWSNDKLHGKGIYQWKATNTRFEGSFADHRLIKGRITFADGSTYDGDVNSDDPITFNGKGKRCHSNGDVVEGEFKEGCLSHRAGNDPSVTQLDRPLVVLANETSSKYQQVHYLNYSDVMEDGFFDGGHLAGIGGIDYIEKRLDEYKSDREIIVVNAQNDDGLAACVAEAESKCCLITDPRVAIEQLGLFVSDKFGGPMPALGQSALIVSAWKGLNSRQLPIGNLLELRVGACRHRAILFKYLADRLSFPFGKIDSRLIRGLLVSNQTEPQQHAWNVVRVSSRHYLIDVTNKPGDVIEEHSKEAMRYRRSLIFSIGASTVENIESVVTIKCRDDLRPSPFSPPFPGAFSQLFKAFWNSREVVIKSPSTFDPKSYSFKQLLAEVRILAMLRHPNVVSLLAVIEEPTSLVLEYVPGATLADTSVANMTWTAKFRLMLQIAETIAALHALDPPLVHRDIKARNIMVNLAGDAKLLDFGLARFLKSTNALSTTNQSAGTHSYSAPEQISEQPLTPAVDVYAFAGLIYYFLSNTEPWHRAIAPVVLRGVASGDRPELSLNDNSDQKKFVISDIGCQLLELMNDCYRHEPLARPTMVEVSQRLRDMTDRVTFDERLRMTPLTLPVIKLVIEYLVMAPHMRLERSISDESVPFNSQLVKIVAKSLPPYRTESNLAATVSMFNCGLEAWPVGTSVLLLRGRSTFVPTKGSITSSIVRPNTEHKFQLFLRLSPNAGKHRLMFQLRTPPEETTAPIGELFGQPFWLDIVTEKWWDCHSCTTANQPPAVFCTLCKEPKP